MGLEDGVHQFVLWLREYNMLGGNDEAGIFFDALKYQADGTSSRLFREMIDQRQSGALTLHESRLQTWKYHATAFHIALPELPPKKKFVFVPLVRSDGFDLLQYVTHGFCNFNL